MAKILTAEDGSDILEVMDILLTKAAHGVFRVEADDMAVMQAGVLQPGLILLDIDMPELDGFEVLERLTGDVETVEIPVVVVSGRDGFEDISHGLALGAVDYITRPFSGKDIINAVRAILVIGA
jgi:DNA-binding response OmpR family regulator